MSEQSIYLISHHELEKRKPIHRNPDYPRWEKPADFYKIGISKDPEWRVENMNTSTPHNLKLQTTIESDTPKKVEDKLHSIFRRQLQQGEWYWLTANQANSLKALDRLSLDELRHVRWNYTDRCFTGNSTLYIEVVRYREEKNE
jgi:hypothetical protein